MASSWVIVADASRARIFAADKNLSNLSELATFAHPESRLHEQELTSDLPGRSFDTQGEGRHAMGQKHDPKQHEAQQFAQQIAEHLDNSRKQNKYDRLVIISSPAMLGLLRDNLTNETKELVTDEINKDLTQHSIADIQQHLPTHSPA